MMRDRLATFLRYLARRLFALADRVGPDALTRALDVAYDPRRAWSDRELADELREIRGTLKPWHPEKLTAFQRKQWAQR